MKAKVLKTEQDYDWACARVYELIHSKDEPLEANSPEGEELELLSMLVENYEREHYPVDAPSPIEAIRFRMDQMGLRQNDIAPLLGGKTRVSEIMNGKRPLTLKMITLLNRYLGIPLESLIGGDKDFELTKQNRELLLGNKVIREYLASNSVN